MAQQGFTHDEDIRLLVDVLPESLRVHVRELPTEELLEVVMDLGRRPEARLAARVVTLGEHTVQQEDLKHVLRLVSRVGEDHRAGIERTLHRISAIQNRRGEVIGLTLRVGRAMFGTIDALRDLIESGKNVLLLGRPGVGKTTKLREVARVLADDLHKRVMVVDTSNEIGGDGDVPHPGIGGARRMQVPRPDRQHGVMIEAVENHMPEVIIVDEIGTEAEAAAARTIAERGVQLIATAHGNTLENLVLNPTLSDLVGGVQTVTLGDEEAHRRRTQKTITERRGPPTFDILVELVSRDEVLVHPDTAQAVDQLLAGRDAGGERRTHREGKVEVQEVPKAVAPLPTTAPAPVRPAMEKGPRRIYPHAISKDVLGKILRDMRLNARVVRTPDSADLILSLKSRSDDPRVKRAIDRSGATLHILKRNSGGEMRRALKNAFFIAEGYEEDEVREAVREAEHAIHRVLNEGVTLPLAPRPPGLRRVQHKLVSRYHLETTSMGSEPMRHLVIFPVHGKERAAEESLQ